MKFLVIALFFIYSFSAEAKHLLNTKAYLPHCSKLKNGMNVCSIKDTKSDIILHSIMYNVGGANDPYGKSGLAHFLEHLMFKGTKKHKNFIEEMSKMGASNNAMTSTHSTIYYGVVRKKDLKNIMSIEADRMQNILFSSEEITKENKVVQQERLMRIDNVPANLMQEEMQAVFYGDDYSRPNVGWMEDIKQLTLRDAKNFYYRYYQPNNATLLVVGNIDFHDVMSLASSQYGNLKNRKQRAVLKKHSKAMRNRDVDIAIYMKNKNVSDNLFSVWYKAPNVIDNADSYIILHFLSRFLVEHNRGKLYEYLVSSKKIAKEVSIYYDGFTKAGGKFCLYVTPSDGVSMNVVRKEINSFFDELIKKGISMKELFSFKQFYIASNVFQLDGLLSKALFYFSSSSIGVNKDIISMYSEFNIKDKQVLLDNVVKSVFSSKKVFGYLNKE